MVYADCACQCICVCDSLGRSLSLALALSLFAHAAHNFKLFRRSQIHFHPYITRTGTLLRTHWQPIFVNSVAFVVVVVVAVHITAERKHSTQVRAVCNLSAYRAQIFS